ncbi:hypothetical protein [Pseudochryseolinea flava]|uniref:TonB C-terminal domain-containing protein n=1 Tax=Pseudochryseolinea flava TaxID=2059302 RepID=A0A364XYR1_9BACT|nr:hypothetical protein [Pseudochryseolinea flava]RAV99461.1 hypothetical protein DQQ10_19795 [Pseudochryseolinea flava]
MNNLYIVIFSFLLLTTPLFAQQPPTYKQCKASHDSIDGMKVMMVTEEMAKYRSGEREMVRMVADSIKYPKGQKPPLEKILVEWVVDTLGQVRNPCILKRNGEAKLNHYELEILRVVALLKDWTPGKHKGKKVPTLISMPIIIDARE